MNVAFDPWIPVVSTSGGRELASLLQVLAEGENYADLAVQPQERVSLMRLFLCIVHAALDGPKDYDEWGEVPDKLPDAARAYLATWKDSFELFHAEKPWLQVASISKEADGKRTKDSATGWASVAKLNFAFSSGNNSTLFDHGALDEGRMVLIEETIISMLSFQCFSTGGLISQVYWNGSPTGKIPKAGRVPVSKDAPCVPASMIHAFLRGKTLQDTIHLNLPTYENVQLSYGDYPLGRPVWEMMPASLSDEQHITNATKTYLGRLVPLTRLILLHANGQRMLLGDGLVYPAFADGFPPEPTATVTIKKNDKEESRTLLSYRPEKALWRELAAIVVKRKAGETGGPIALAAIAEDRPLDVFVGALARNQASFVDTIESVFHVPARLRTQQGTASYEAEVKIAEKRASLLGWAVETYRADLDGGWEGRVKAAGAKKGALKAKLHSVATTHYWTSVENNLPLLMAYVGSIGGDSAVPSREAWRKMLFASACEAYRLACGQETPRQLRAFAKGWRRLMAKKSENEKDESETQEEEAE